MMLAIDNLHVSVDNKPILKGISLTINPGEVHAVMGPNGSGKSTLSHVLAGRDGYTVDRGSVTLEGSDLLAMNPEARSLAGLFLAFQYPVAIPGISNIYLLKAAYNAKLRAQGEAEVDAAEFMAMVQEKIQLVHMDPDLLYRSVNDGFSGGEKKRNEILQMLLLDPKLAILDEIDSGLDIDALQFVAKGVNALRDASHSFLLITHYQRLLNHIVPNHVHVLADGQLIASGDKQLAQDIEARGYGWLLSSSETVAVK